MNKQTIIGGICGGIGSGKSTIADQFQLLGAAVFDADRAGHRVLMRDDVKANVMEQWGAEVFDSEAEIDRSKVAALVFAETAQGQRDRDFLQSISHPLIQLDFEAFIAQAGTEVVILDAALLFEAGWRSLCDRIIFVDTAEGVRLKRCQERGWGEDEFHSREATQWSVERKRGQADFVIDNGGDLQRTAKEVQKVWQALSALVKEGV